MATMLLVLILLLVSFLPSSLSTSVTFSLTYTDAESSVLRSLEADPADLPQSMPMRDFVAAGRAMRARLENHRNKGGALVYKISYMENIAVGDFYLTVPVGTPPQDLIFLVDTGSELTWSHCCKNCTHMTSPPQFSPNHSSSFLKVPCDSRLCTSSLGFRVSSPCNNFCKFSVGYGDNSTADGLSSVDAFHLTPHYSELMVFGCTMNSMETAAPMPGLMGLSPGPFSFTSQLFASNPNLEKKFAHCLPDRLANLNAPGTIKFGNYELGTNLSYTPFAISYSPLAALFYYVKLEGITVGGSRIKLQVANKWNGVGEGGTIFDSGTALTYLEKSLYNALVAEMKRQTTHLRPFAWTTTAGIQSDLCYKVSLKASELPKVPLVTLHFAGTVDLELNPESILYVAHFNHKSAFFCLALKNADDAGFNINIIGNYQQQSYWVEYNLQTSHLGLAKARCPKY